MHRLTCCLCSLLSPLSSSFLKLYANSPALSKICTDYVADSIGAPRSRFIELMDILESLSIVRRTGSKHYHWLRDSKLAATLQELQCIHIDEKFVSTDGLASTEPIDPTCTFTSPIVIPSEERASVAATEPKSSSSSPTARQFTQELVRMFFTTTTRIVTYSEAARWMLGQATIRHGETLEQATKNWKGQFRLERVEHICRTVRFLAAIMLRY